ncbi:MAG: amidohydrolase family protein [Balneolales bacterium]|nr:amidohydrolase family protein [Balneolales bacterium]
MNKYLTIVALLIGSWLVSGFFSLFFTADAHAQEQPIAFTGATIYPISSPPIENGVMVVQNGRILAVGAAGSVTIPTAAQVKDASGYILMPGLVDTHSHIGGGDGGDRSSALHPDVRIKDAVDVRSDTFRKARTGGVTVANVMPGSGHLLSGQTIYLKLRDARTIYDMLIPDENLRDGFMGGIKMANGTNPLRQPPFPGTRAKSATMQRELFIQAQEYQQRLQNEENVARNLRLEPMVEALEGNRIIHFHTHRHDDILTVLRMQREFGFRVVLHHVTDAWLVADEIAAAGIPSSIIVLDTPGGKLEAINLLYKSGRYLEEAGADVAFHTDDSVTDSRLFFRMAAFAVRDGMSREKALEALTLAGARMLDLQDRVGSLEPGKDADFILLTGDPFSVYTHVQQTWIDGIKVFDRANPDQLPFATGGHEVYRGDYFDHYSTGGAQ